LTALRQQQAELTTTYKTRHPRSTPKGTLTWRFEIDRLQAGVKAENGIIQLRGNVEIKTGIFTLVARKPITTKTRARSKRAAMCV